MEKKEFFDEKIIQMMNEVKQPKAASEEIPTGEVKPEASIYTGLKIKGQWTEFEERSLLGDKITMMIPKKFTEMNLATAKKKYASDQRPNYILSDKSGTINLLFEHIEAKVTNEEIESMRDQVFGLMKKTNLGIRKHSVGAETVSDKTIAYVEFTNPAMDGKVYNLLFFVELDEQVLMVSFNCRTKSMNFWQKSFFEMMKSLTIVEKGEIKNEN